MTYPPPKPNQSAGAKVRFASASVTVRSSPVGASFAKDPVRKSPLNFNQLSGATTRLPPYSRPLWLSVKIFVICAECVTCPATADSANMRPVASRTMLARLIARAALSSRCA